MILKVKIIFAGLFVSGLVMPRWAMAYELGTHARLTQKAHERSILGNPQTGPTLLKELGIDSAKISPFGDTYYDVSGSDIRQRKADPFEARFMPVGAEETLTLPAWLMRGAIREDDVPFGENPMDDPVNAVRVLNHFYDPIHDRPLAVLLPLGEKAPDWGLGMFDVFKNPNEENFNRSNHYTILDAREAMYRALTGRDTEGKAVANTKKERDKYWATTFRALGDVVHLIQDMAQPQHTRNEPHAGEKFDGIKGPLGHKSVYESYVDARATQGDFTTLKLTTSLAPSLSFRPRELVYEDYPTPRFTDYLSYFTTRHQGQDLLGRQGMADYSNRSFFTAGKNVNDTEYVYPFKLLTDRTQELTTDWTGQPLPNGASVTLLLGDVPDSLTGTSAGDVPLSTVGVFDQFLQQAGKPADYTLTRPNYDAMANLLVPRAVAYSAGLIDYFFRGRLSAEDAGFTDQGIVLRVKNAIDLKKDPHLKDELLHAGGPLVLAYRYKLNEQEQVGASSPVALTQDVKPGETSSAFYTFNVPALPAAATDIDYRLVYRGKLGQEPDAVAAGIVKPASGFVVTPNYTPADGVGGQRLIYRTADQWRLSRDNTLVAGNTDWKGWYVNGKPTKVLSWSGPTSRYFEDIGHDHLGFPFLVVPFEVNIYQNGELYAVAPAPVMGAALMKDAQGQEWLVAICQGDMEDVVYRRPNKKSDSPALFNAQTAPEGWKELGQLAQAPEDLDPGIPWFFNGSGTEAQTMRRWIDPQDPQEIEQLKRLKVGISGVSAQFENKGNLPGVSGQRTCEENYDADGAGSASLTVATGGEYIIAVDYKDGQEVLAKVAHAVQATTASTVSVTKENNQVVTRDGQTTQQNSLIETLKWGGQDLVTLSDVGGFQLSWHDDNKNFSNSSTKQDDTDSFKAIEITYFMDLRYDLYAYSQLAWDTEGHLESSGGKNTVSNGKQDFTDQTRIISNIVSPIVLYTNTQLPKAIQPTWKPGALKCSFSGTQPLGPSVVLNFGWVNNLRLGGGAWLVDTQNNLLISQKYYTEGGFVSDEPFNHLSNGDLITVIPGGSSASRYSPAGVVR